MRLQIIKSKNAQSLYAVKSVYHNKKRTNKVIEKLGTYGNLKNTLDEDPIAWAKKYKFKQILMKLPYREYLS